MPLPDGAHTVTYTLVAHDPEQEAELVHVDLGFEFRGPDPARLDEAVRGGVEAIVADLQTTTPVPIVAYRRYETTVPGDPWPTPPEEV